MDTWSADKEVTVKATQKHPAKVVLEGDMTAITLAMPNNNPNEVADDIEITAYQLLEILRVNHLTPFFTKQVNKKG